MIMHAIYLINKPTNGDIYQIVILEINRLKHITKQRKTQVMLKIKIHDNL